MSAVIRVGTNDSGHELYQPMCLDHEPKWFGPETFDLPTAQVNVRVHNTDRHGPAPPTSTNTAHPTPPHQEGTSMSEESPPPAAKKTAKKAPAPAPTAAPFTEAQTTRLRALNAAVDMFGDQGFTAGEALALARWVVNGDPHPDDDGEPLGFTGAPEQQP